MSSRYSDTPGRASRSSTSNSSYTDRFRVDNDFPSDFQYPASSSSRERPQPTTAMLVTLIERACSQHLQEPNLALNLEIADLITQKKGS